MSDSIIVYRRKKNAWVSVTALINHSSQRMGMGMMPMIKLKKVSCDIIRAIIMHKVVKTFTNFLNAPFVE